MFNLQGSEIIFILLLALVVLGPEKLPGAIRRFTRTYAELKKMSTGFQTELKSALDEPMKEMRETADLVRRSADPGRLFDEEEAAAAAAAERDRDQAARAAGDPPATVDGGEDEPETVADPDPFADPVDDPLESESESAETESTTTDPLEPDPGPEGPEDDRDEERGEGAA